VGLVEPVPSTRIQFELQWQLKSSFYPWLSLMPCQPMPIRSSRGSLEYPLNIDLLIKSTGNYEVDRLFLGDVLLCLLLLLLWLLSQAAISRHKVEVAADQAALQEVLRQGEVSGVHPLNQPGIPASVKVRPDSGHMG
jgi:hypothetical protein